MPLCRKSRAMSLAEAKQQGQVGMQVDRQRTVRLGTELGCPEYRSLTGVDRHEMGEWSGE